MCLSERTVNVHATNLMAKGVDVRVIQANTHSRVCLICFTGATAIWVRKLAHNPCKILFRPAA